MWKPQFRADVISCSHDWLKTRQLLRMALLAPIRISHGCIFVQANNVNFHRTNCPNKVVVVHSPGTYHSAVRYIVFEVEASDKMPFVWCSSIAVVYASVSAFFILSTTGTDVQGTMPISVMTRDTSSGGVTSYTRFNRLRDDMSRQLLRGVTLRPIATRSSGSPKHALHYNVNGHHRSLKLTSSQI